MKGSISLILPALYILVALYFIVTQGLMGESFIAIILGLPWTLLLALIEFGGADGVVVAVLLLSTMAINAFLLYLLGNYIARKFAQ